MNKVFELARELGEALANSEEYIRMQETENAAMSDPSVSEKMTAYLEAKSSVEEELSNEAPDSNKLAQYSQQMQSAQSELNGMELVKVMTQARQDFADMMKQVNQVLEFTLTGKISEEGSCGGNCSSCAGCH